MVFANIEYLFLLLLLMPYIVWYILKHKKNNATLQMSDTNIYSDIKKAIKYICCMLHLFYELLFYL